MKLNGGTRPLSSSATSNSRGSGTRGGFSGRLTVFGPPLPFSCRPRLPAFCPCPPSWLPSAARRPVYRPVARHACASIMAFICSAEIDCPGVTLRAGCSCAVATCIADRISSAVDTQRMQTQRPWFLRRTIASPLHMPLNKFPSLSRHRPLYARKWPGTNSCADRRSVTS